MVNEKILIRNKYKFVKKVGIVLAVIIVIGLILGAMFIFGFFSGEKIQVVLENPLKGIVFANTNEAGQVDEEAVIEQAIIKFDEEFMDYILIALGVGVLHKSPLFENPLIEFKLGDEIWSSEIIDGVPNSKKEDIDNEDLRISIQKKEAVKALLSEDIEQFMKDSVASDNTQIEIVAGKAELFSKGYLDMYEKLIGEEVVVE